MTDPSFLPFQDSLNQTSLFTYRTQYHFICCMILPRHPLHSSPYPHFKRIQSVNFLLSQCPYLATIESNWPHKCLNYFFFNALLILLVRSSFLLLNASFAIPILTFTSVKLRPSSVTIAPRYLNFVTCSIICPSITKFTLAPTSFETTIHLVFSHLFSYHNSLLSFPMHLLIVEAHSLYWPPSLGYLQTSHPSLALPPL